MPFVIEPKCKLRKILFHVCVKCRCHKQINIKTFSSILHCDNDHQCWCDTTKMKLNQSCTSSMSLIFVFKQQYCMRVYIVVVNIVVVS